MCRSWSFKKHYPVTPFLELKCLSSPADPILPLHIWLLKNTLSLCSAEASSLELEARVKVKQGRKSEMNQIHFILHKNFLFTSIEKISLSFQLTFYLESKLEFANCKYRGKDNFSTWSYHRQPSGFHSWIPHTLRMSWLPYRVCRAGCNKPVSTRGQREKPDDPGRTERDLFVIKRWTRSVDLGEALRIKRAKDDAPWGAGIFPELSQLPCPEHPDDTKVASCSFRAGHTCSFLRVVIKAGRRWGSPFGMPSCTSIDSFVLKGRNRQGEFALGPTSVNILAEHFSSWSQSGSGKC